MPRLLALVIALFAVAAGWAGPVTAASAATTKLVRYRGLTLPVPASWPVFDLARDPRVCVRFNRHAVYLGRPSPGQQCPALAPVGRTGAILVMPAAVGASAASAPTPVLPGAGRGAGETVVRGLGLRVIATWSGAGRTVRAILHGRHLRPIPAFGSRAVARAARARPPFAHSATAAYTGPGFDACSAPSAGALTAWGASPYRAVGVYIGGANMACAQPNLSAAYVDQETAAGWTFLPIYVGLEAPGACGCASISSSQASSEGTAAANNAVSQAQSYGFGPGNVIYDDMEGYPHSSSNTSAVLAFLAAWTTQLHSLGYLSGVYSSTDSGVVDLVSQYGTSYPEPDDLWFARWNGQASTSDPVVPATDWPNHQRLHQYSGAHNETYGGVTINIDGDYVDASTATGGCGSSGIPDGTFVEVQGTSTIYEVAGGAALLVPDATFVGSAPVQPITAEQLTLMCPVVKDGTFLETTGGYVYRVAGGAPLLVTDWAGFGGPQPAIAVDPWDIDNAGSPYTGLHSIPINGTFLTTTAGQVYRTAGGAAFPISSWSVFGGPQPSITVDAWDVQNAGNPLSHLLARPIDGTLVEGLPSHWYWSFSSGWRALGHAGPGAITVDDPAVVGFPGQGALPYPQCIVPRLKGLSFAEAKRAMIAALCRKGKVGRPRRWGRHHVLRVWWQIPRAGRSFPEEHRIGIKMK